MREAGNTPGLHAHASPRPENQTIPLASDLTRRPSSSAALCAPSARCASSSLVDFTVDFALRSASRRFRLNRRSPWSRCRCRVRVTRRRADAPRRSDLRRFVVASRCRREIRRRTSASLRSGLAVTAIFSPAVTAAPTAVSATRCARQPNDFRLLACARARVSAAFVADRLRRAAFRLRVAAAFWAAAFRCVSVCVATGNHLP
jgi:hypothetical protein